MIKLLAVTALSLTFSVGVAGASTFSGHTAGYFTSENGHSGTYITGSSEGSNTLLQWGYTPDRYDDDETYDTSFLQILDYSFDQELVSGQNEIRVGALRWYNASSTHVDSQFSAHAWLRFDLDEPTNLPWAWDYVGFNISSTSNSGNPADDSVLGVSFDDYNLNLPINIADRTFLTGFDYRAVGGGLDGNEWTNAEDSYSYLEIYAQVEVVPLPAAGWMLLAGVGGLAAMRRRKRAT
ncbi:MAG: VPLPA-CTERM sorting domain-containing protein [Roseobacter sp.]|jgi:hypothetical protein|nr:VPLPA-CTERM sorting domain-containing protein [Roseobacter sp.]